MDGVKRKCQVKMIHTHRFQITLTQGLNRQIRRMCEYFGYEVTKLERTRIMDIQLGTLQQGDWRDMTEAELTKLFDMIEASDNEEKPKTNAPKKSTPKSGTSKPQSQSKTANKGGAKPHNKRSSVGTHKGSAPKRRK